MKILFLTTGNENLGSTRYRALQWVDYLNNKGWKAEWIFARHIRVKKFISIVKKVRSANIVHIQKKLFSRPFLFFIKKLNQNIIYDFDDALYTRDSFSINLSAIGNGSRKTIRRLKYVIKSAKTVIAGSEQLGNYASQFNNNVRVIPTTVLFSDYQDQ